jgi:hypothetical protein
VSFVVEVERRFRVKQGLPQLAFVEFYDESFGSRTRYSVG